MDAGVQNFVVNIIPSAAECIPVSERRIIWHELSIRGVHRDDSSLFLLWTSPPLAGISGLTSIIAHLPFPGIRGKLPESGAAGA